MLTYSATSSYLATSSHVFLNNYNWFFSVFYDVAKECFLLKQRISIGNSNDMPLNDSEVGQALDAIINDDSDLLMGLSCAEQIVKNI